MEKFKKKPFDDYPVDIDFTGRLPKNDPLASGVASAEDDEGANVTATVLTSTSVSIGGSGTIGTIRPKAGTDGKDYTISMEMTTVAGYKFKECVLMEVREK